MPACADAEAAAAQSYCSPQNRDDPRMAPVTTHGRYPTLGEVLEYYSREDVLAAILRTCATHEAVLVVPSRRHWEPNWGGGPHLRHLLRPVAGVSPGPDRRAIREAGP